MKVFLSPIAEKKLFLLLEYLEKEWFKKSADLFLKKFLNKTKQVSQFPKSSIKSKEFPNLYKCIVTKHTSFFYRIKDYSIEIITLIDNRQDPTAIPDELKEFISSN